MVFASFTNTTLKVTAMISDDDLSAVRHKMRNLSDEEIDAIAEKAAEKAAQRVIEDVTSRIYMEVGKTVLSKLLWMVGALVVGLIIWGTSTGWLK